MKILTISSNKLELARAQLRKPFVTIGRSPSCDVVLRAPGVQAIHFVIEWIGSGEFNPNQGFWSIADISQAGDSQSGAESGEGIVFAEKPIESSGFVFACIQDRLESAEQIGGKIVTNLGVSVSGKSEVLELIQVRTDSGAIEEVRHLKLKRTSGKERVLPGVREFKIEWCGKKAASESFLKVLLEEMPGAEVYNRGQKVPLVGALNVKPLDILRICWRGRDFFVRLVDEVSSPPIPQEVVQDGLLRRLIISIGSTAFLLLLLLQFYTPKDKGAEKPPARIARIEVAKAPEPEPKGQDLPKTEEPVVLPKFPPKEPPPEAPKEIKAEKPPAKPNAEPKEQMEQVVTKAPAKQTEKKNPPLTKQPAKAAAPSVAKAPNEAPKAGLNTVAKKMDVNAVGILGALKKAGPKGAGVQVNQIVNDAVVTDSISGAEASRVVLKNPPSGTLSNKSGGGSVKGDNGSNLSAASTTLSGVGKADPNAHGAIAFATQKSGVGLGSDLSSVATSGGSGGSSIGTVDGSEFSVEGGGLDRETVRRVIASYKSQIRTCYERALLTKANLEGRIVYDWRIGTDGVVVTAEISKTTLNSPNLASCVLSVVKKMSFPPSKNDRSTRVIYPFVFQGRK